METERSRHCSEPALPDRCDDAAQGADEPFKDLATQAQWLSIALDAGNMGVWMFDVAKEQVIVDDTLTAITGVGPAGTWIPASAFIDRVHKDDLQAFEAAVEDAIQNRTPYDLEFRFHRSPDEEIWLAGKGERLGSEYGAAPRMAGVNYDVTARKLAELQARFVASEMAHRVKNLIALVQGMSRLTLRSVDTLEEFGTRFNGRLMALDGLNDLIVGAAGLGVPIKTLADQTLAPVAADDRITICMPDFTLNDAAAQTFVLALNELATNAVKYGALSHHDGQVEVGVEIDGAADGFLFYWREHAPSGIDGVPKRRGFGTQVLERMTRATFNGSPVFDWQAHGLHYHCTWKASAMSA